MTGTTPSWQFDAHISTWWLRNTPNGTYSIRFSGWDFRVYRHDPGKRTSIEICSRLNIAAARTAAEQHATNHHDTADT